MSLYAYLSPIPNIVVFHTQFSSVMHPNPAYQNNIKDRKSVV